MIAFTFLIACTNDCYDDTGYSLWPLAIFAIAIVVFVLWNKRSDD